METILIPNAADTIKGFMAYRVMLQVFDKLATFELKMNVVHIVVSDIWRLYKMGLHDNIQVRETLPIIIAVLEKLNMNLLKKRMQIVVDELDLKE